MPLYLRLSLALFLTLLAFSTRSEAKVPCEDLNDLWQARFYSDFNVSWAKAPVKCPSADATLAKALYDVYKPDLEFNFYDWSKDLVKKLYYESNCSKGVVATMRSDGVMKICAAFYTDQEVSRAGTIVHEAAHAQKGDEGHVTCTKGVSKGGRACDQKLYEGMGGSGYNYEFVYLAQLLEVPSYDELDKALIRHTIRFMVNNRFNTVTQGQIKKWANI